MNNKAKRKNNPKPNKRVSVSSWSTYHIGKLLVWQKNMKNKIIWISCRKKWKIMKSGAFSIHGNGRHHQVKNPFIVYYFIYMYILIICCIQYKLLYFLFSSFKIFYFFETLQNHVRWKIKCFPNIMVYSSIT